MNPLETAELDESRLTSESRLFAADLFARFPEFRQYAAMDRVSSRGDWTLVVKVPAPSDDPRSELIVWVDGGDDPSVGFGIWHTHENVWGARLPDGAKRDALLDLIEGIVADRYLVCEDIGGISVGTGALLDLSEDDILLEELTSKDSPGRAHLRSWSGRLDREVSLDDLELDKPT